MPNLSDDEINMLEELLFEYEDSRWCYYGCPNLHSYTEQVNQYLLYEYELSTQSQRVLRIARELNK